MSRVLARPRPTPRLARLHRIGSGLLMAAVLVLAFAGGLLGSARPALAVLLVVLPLIALAVVVPPVALVPAVALLVFPNDIAAGRAGVLDVAVSDVLMVIGLVGIALAALARPVTAHGARPLRRFVALGLVVALYFAAYVVALLAHPSTAGLAGLSQRVELVVVSLLAGAYLARVGWWRAALLGYLGVAVILAVSAVATTVVHGASGADIMGVQKNPAGQALAVALLLALGVPRVRWRPVLVVVLAAGLLASLSRGAILAAAIGVAVLAVATLAGGERRDRQRLVAMLLVGVAAVALAFALLGPTQQSRLLTLDPTRDYADRTRVDYAHDALAAFRTSPVLGVGPGNYRGGVLAPLVADPHDVVLLELAEGGVVLALGFGLLQATSMIVVLRRIRGHPLARVALAAQVTTVAHALVDVYWVRDTPVMGWVLVGMVCVLARPADARAPGRPSAADHQPVLTPSPAAQHG